MNKLRIGLPSLDSKAAAETRLALQAGAGLMLAEGSNRPRLKDVIWRLSQEAVETMKSLPDKERSWLHANERAVWPELARPSEDCRLIEWEISIALMGGTRTVDVTFVRPVVKDRSAIDRMLVVLGWLRFVQGKHASRDRRAFLALAMGTPPRFVKVKFFPYCHSDSTVRMAKDRVLQHIAVGVAPYSNGLTFDGA